MQIEYIGGFQVVLGVLAQFWPVWVGAGRSCWVPSFVYKKRLGLYGQLFDSGVGIAGVAHLLLLAVHRDLRRTDRAVRSARRRCRS